jgi:hypothetical protein
VSNTLFQQALAKSTPDAYNPFNGGNQLVYSGPDTTPSDPATIRSFLVGVHRVSETSLSMWDLKASRPDIGKLPAGDVGAAVGVEVRRESYVDDRDARLDGTIKYTDSVTGITYGTDVMGASPAPDTERIGRSSPATSSWPCRWWRPRWKSRWSGRSTCSWLPVRSVTPTSATSPNPRSRSTGRVADWIGPARLRFAGVPRTQPRRSSTARERR